MIVKLSAIGDVVHTLPSLAMLRRCLPEARISWVVEEAAADLLVNHPALDRLIVSRRKKWLADLKKGIITRPFRELGAFVTELRAEKYDVVIDFHGLFKSAVIVALSGGRRKLGYKSLQEGTFLFYNEKIPEDMTKHAVDRYLDFVRYLVEIENLQCRDEAPTFTIAIGEKEERRINDLLTAGGATKQRPLSGFIAVSPVAFWPTKLWQDAKFAELCDRIQKELRTRVVLTGEKVEQVERIANLMKTSVLNLGGRTSLRELAALYKRAALLVTTDSGPMHIAAAVGTPVVALFGPTDPSRTGPYGFNHRIIQRKLPCSPCFRKQCTNPRCMAEISVEEVFAAVRDMLREGRR